MPSLQHREAEWAGLLKGAASHTVLAVQILRALRVLGESLTRTHGGDIHEAPIADSVMAIHIVLDGGRHCWIERRNAVPVMDEAKIRSVYGAQIYGGELNFSYIRDDMIFNATLVSVGRFGVIYSVVLKAVPQYNLYESRRLALWQTIKPEVPLVEKSPGLYMQAPPLPPIDGYQLGSTPENEQRFLQIVVCLTPHANFTRNLAGVTRRWKAPLPPTPRGREERVGSLEAEFDPYCGGPRFKNAGSNFAYSASRHPSMLEIACADANFMKGLLQQLARELEEFYASGTTIVGALLAPIVVPGGGGAVAIALALPPLLHIIAEIADALGIGSRIASVMNELRRALLDAPGANPQQKAAGLFIWQALAAAMFNELQKNKDIDGISYAIMDTHDYRMQSCAVDVDSVEVFFDAKDPRCTAYIDALILFETNQEAVGRACLGYAAMRFMKASAALLAPQRWETTCSIEVACVRGVEGSQQMVDFATSLALNPSVGGFLHWGQRVDYVGTQADLRYGTRLRDWRSALRELYRGGTGDAFRSAFTTRVGLEPN